MKYYKVCLGYNEFIPIEEMELNKAIRAQTEGAITVFKKGSVNGKYITHIIPDYHRALGYNYAYKLESEDYSQIKSIEISYSEALENCVKELKTGLMAN